MADPEAELREVGLPLVQDAALDGKVVLVRVDHNCVKGGRVTDPYRVDATLGTLYSIVERGGRPVLMSHVGRPRDSRTGLVTAGPDTDITPVVRFLERRLCVRFHVPDLEVGEKGIRDVDTSVNLALRKLRARQYGGLYLPNTRWFAGEQASGEAADRFAQQLAGLADVYVNDAFGSWQPHVSTYAIAAYLPCYAGQLLQRELAGLRALTHPQRPFVAVVAGSKLDTKLGTLSAIHGTVDSLVLGGAVYNAYLCAKYGCTIAGVSDADVHAAKALVELDARSPKVVELPFVVESDRPPGAGREAGTYRTMPVEGTAAFAHVLDAAPESFAAPDVAAALAGARTIFVNAVMGAMPAFPEGTRALDAAVHANARATKLYGGGDTLQELKSLSPGLYLEAVDAGDYVFFTGGGSVLKALELGSPYALAPVRALVENGGQQRCRTYSDKCCS